MLIHCDSTTPIQKIINASVVRFKDGLQEGRRHSNGWRDWGKLAGLQGVDGSKGRWSMGIA